MTCSEDDVRDAAGIKRIDDAEVAYVNGEPRMITIEVRSDAIEGHPDAILEVRIGAARLPVEHLVC